MVRAIKSFLSGVELNRVDPGFCTSEETVGKWGHVYNSHSSWKLISFFFLPLSFSVSGTTRFPHVVLSYLPTRSISVSASEGWKSGKALGLLGAQQLSLKGITKLSSLRSTAEGLSFLFALGQVRMLFYT